MLEFLPLRPCPHCGANAWMDTRLYVRCENQSECGNESPYFDTEAEAAAWWNRRPDDAHKLQAELNDLKSQNRNLIVRVESQEQELRHLAIEAWQVVACIAPYDAELSKRKYAVMRRCEKWKD